MEFSRPVMPFKGTSMGYFESHSFKHIKMNELQSCKVAALSATFRIARQWVRIVQHYWFSMVASQTAFS
jgi:hypothetical protein